MNMKDHRTALKGVSLQHRHFAAIAYALREAKPVNEEHLVQWQATVNSFVDLCRSSNGRFDRERFLSACGND